MEKDTRPRSPGRVGEPHDPDSGSWWPLRPGHPRSWPLLWSNVPSLGEMRSWEELNGRPAPVHHQRPPPTLEIDTAPIRSSWVPIDRDELDTGFDDDPEEVTMSIPLVAPEPPPAAEPPAPPPPAPPPKKPRKSVLSPEKLAEIDRLLEDQTLSLSEIARRVRAGHATIRQRANLIRPILGRWSHAA